MRRACPLALLVLAAHIAAARAVPIPEDRTPKDPWDAVEMAGTVWEGPDGSYAYKRMVFEPDGTLSYSHKGGNFRSGTWRMEGNTVYFQVNKQYREFRGTVTGNILTGESWNKAGKRWKTEMQRAAPG